MTPGGVLVFRGGEVESRHAVRLAIVDSTGVVHARLGDADAPVVFRSAAKPFQAAAALASGALDRFGVSEEELAVICASHSAEEEHTRIVSGLLRRLGLDEKALRCGPHPPIHQATAERVGSAASAIHNNCSGKHAGMLALARHLGVPAGQYLDPEGPVQRRIREAVASACGLRPDEITRATDGCSAPIFAVPLRAAARAYACLARPEGAPPALAEALSRIGEAMTKHPRLVAGTGRFDTVLMAEAGGRLVTKAGAEAVQGAAHRERGLGFFLKVEDGSARAAAPATIEALRQSGWLGPELAEPLRDWWRPKLTNYAGRVVGRIEAEFVLEIRSPT